MVAPSASEFDDGTRAGRGRQRILSWVIAAAAIEVVLWTVVRAATPAEQVARVLLAYAVANIVWLLQAVDIWRRRPAFLGHGELAVVVIGGLLFRATLFFVPPATSPDVHRYLWEGLVQTQGIDPYRVPPGDASLDALAAARPALGAAMRHASVHPEIASIYPPAAQLLFYANAALFNGTLIGWKLILLFFDALLSIGVVLLLRPRGAGRAGFAIVWWCPLLLFECYEGGHLDLIGVALLVVGLVAFGRRQFLLAGILLGVSVNVKYLWPLIVGMYLFGRAGGWRQRTAFAAGAMLAGAGLWLPYWESLPAALATVRMFAEHWTFNDWPFELLRMVLYPRWMPMAVILVLLGALAWRLGQAGSENRWNDVWLLGGLGLLLGPVNYPWYFLWVAPGLACSPPGWLVLWILSVPALHLVDWWYAYYGTWNAMPWLWVIVGIVPSALLLRACYLRIRETAQRRA